MDPEDTPKECATQQIPTPLRSLVGGSCTLQALIDRIGCFYQIGLFNINGNKARAYYYVVRGIEDIIASLPSSCFDLQGSMVIANRSWCS